MNQPLRDAFSRELDDAGRFDVDVEALVGQGETRLRQRRLAAILGAAAAVALVATAIGLSALSGTGTPRPGPSHHPPQHEQTPTERPIVYSDVHVVPGHPDSLVGDPVHVGDQVVETGSGWVHMDVTDDGVVYSTGGYRDDGRVWFTDGGAPEQIGSHACAAPHGSPDTVVTGTSGSLAAWFDCSGPAFEDLVVFDTGLGREVVRARSARCGVGFATCALEAVLGDHVYYAWTHYPHGGHAVVSLRELDVTTGEVEDARSFGQRVRNNPRGLVIGDSWETGTPTLFGEGFAVLGNRLVPSSDVTAPTVFDTATRRPVRLHLPPGYQADHDELGGVDFTLFEWLDDDTVALRGQGRQGGDILTCRLSSGRCVLAVPSHGFERVVPNQGLW